MILKGPFFLANRILRALGLTVALATAFWIWHNREVASPVWNIYEAWRLGKAGPLPVQEWNLTPMKAFDGESFQARSSDGALYTVRLAGVDAPDLQNPRDPVRKEARESRDFLARRLGTNDVRVEVTLTNTSRIILGVVYTGKTNLNAACVAAGHAEFNRDFLVGTSFRSRYALLQAERHWQTRTRN